VGSLTLLLFDEVGHGSREILICGRAQHVAPCVFKFGDLFESAFSTLEINELG